MRDIGLILLASGRPPRTGSPRELLFFNGVPMLRRAAQAAVDSRCRHVVVVSGAASDEAREMVADLPLRVVHNPNWEQGIGTSIHAGIDAMIEYNVDAAVIAVADQPLLTSATFDRLVEAYRRGGLPVVASEYEGTLGTPALFDWELFPQLLDLPADEGCSKIILRQSVERVVRCACPEAAVDIDSRDDYARFREAPSFAHAR